MIPFDGTVVPTGASTYAQPPMASYLPVNGFSLFNGVAISIFQNVNYILTNISTPFVQLLPAVHKLTPTVPAIHPVHPVRFTVPLDVNV